MRIQFVRQTMLALVTLLVIGLCFVDTSAQGTRRRRSRRITNPVRTSTTQPVAQPTPPPTTSDVRIISTADDPLTSDTQDEEQPQVTTRRTNRSRNIPATDMEEESTQRTVNRLSRQVDRLTDKINQIEGQQRALVDLERLSRAEQRAEGFRSQLRDVQAKEADLQARLEQIEYDLKPENIERTAAFYGTTRPEDVRDARRRQLENERTRIQSQLALHQTSRTRLEAAIALADTEVERLRARLDASDPVANPQTNNNNTERTTSSDTTTTTAPATPAPDSTPTGTP
jgi:chromosome segregation ATPase